MKNREKKNEDDGELERQYQSLSQTAASMHTSTKQVKKWINNGLIDAIRPGGKFGQWRVSIKSVEAFLDRYTTGKHENEEGDKPDG